MNPDLAMKALDLQIDMVRWVKSDVGQKYCNSLMDEKVQGGKQPLVSASTLSGMSVHDPQATGQRIVHRVLMLAETFAVTDEIREVIEFGAQSIPPYPLHMTDLPTPQGFVVFERTIIVSDGRGQPLAIKAIAWDVSFLSNEQTYAAEVAREPQPGDKAGAFFTLYTDPRDERDHMHEDWQRDLYPLWIKRREQGVPIPPLLPMLSGVWEFGTVPAEEGMVLFRLLMSFFRFIKEPFVDPRMVVPSRQVRKRAQSIGIPPQVRVVELRKKYRDAHRNPDAQPGNYSHRWFVTPHWRNQWYPSEQRHAPKWIHGYIKGPDDKPFVAKDNIFSVDR